MVYRKIADNFIETELDGELVLLNLQSGRFHALKDTGLAIWRLLDGKNDVSAIRQSMAERYNIDEAACRDKVSAFLQTLTAAGFVEIA